MARYRTERALPISEVSANLHMSGDCLCGAMADQDEHRSEREQIRFFYPEVDRQISEAEAVCRRLGLRYCEWGVKRADFADEAAGAPTCDGCDRQLFRLTTNDRVTRQVSAGPGLQRGTSTRWRGTRG